MPSFPPYLLSLSLSLSLSLAEINSVRGQSSCRPVGRRCGRATSVGLTLTALCRRVEQDRKERRLGTVFPACCAHPSVLIGQERAAA